MTTAIEYFGWVGALLVLSPAIYLAILTVAALFRKEKPTAKSVNVRPRVAVVIPAHNEGVLICSDARGGLFITLPSGSLRSLRHCRQLQR